MSELQELYQEVVMEHNWKPRNFRKLEGADRTAEGFNPFCGDTVTLYLQLGDGGVIADVGFQGSGCAISRASASMMTESINGKTKEEARKIFEAFRQMMTRAPGEEVDAAILGDLEALAGVSEFPTRVKCATLSWHTLNSALSGQEETVSTE
jgi:nitrogen fixation NifU-like protein